MEQIFGALAFYAGSREGVDQYMNAGRVEFETLRQQSRLQHSTLHARLIEARQGTRARQAMKPRFQADADFNRKTIPADAQG